MYSPVDHVTNNKLFVVFTRNVQCNSHTNPGSMSKVYRIARHSYMTINLLLWLLVILSDFIVASLTRVKYSTRNVRWWSKNSSLSFWFDSSTSSTDCVTVLKKPLSFSLLFLPRTLSWHSTQATSWLLMTILTNNSLLKSTLALLYFSNYHLHLLPLLALQKYALKLLLWI